MQVFKIECCTLTLTLEDLQPHPAPFEKAVWGFRGLGFGGLGFKGLEV